MASEFIDKGKAGFEITVILELHSYTTLRAFKRLEDK